MAGSIGNYTLRVDPAVLQSKAEEILALTNTTKRMFDAMTTAVKGTQNYWQGEAGDEYRASYTKREPEIEEMFRRMTEHSTDLRTIAAEYTGVEQKNAEIPVDLPSDFIV